MINNFAKQNLCAGQHDISDSSELHFGEQNTLLRRGVSYLPSFTIYYCHILESSRAIYCVQLIMHNINITLHFISRLDYFAWMCLFFGN